MMPTRTQFLIVVTAIMAMLLAFASANAQYKVRDEYWSGEFPQYNPNYSNALHIDTVNYKVYRYRKNKGGWTDETDRWSPIYLPRKHYAPPSDTKGFAAHENITLAAAGYSEEDILKYFPMTSATIDDLVDWAFLQQKIAEGSYLHMNGTYHTNRDLVIPMRNMYLHIEGNRSVIQWHGQKGTVIRRELPVDNGEALANYGKIEIENLNIKIDDQSANGVNLNSYYHAYLNGVKVFGADTAFNAIFCLQSYNLLCEANSSLHGFVNDYGRWANGSNAASQSNLYVYQSCRVYAPHNGITGFKSIGSSGTEWKNCVAEGHILDSGFEIDGANSTVVKDAVIWSPHVEIVNGTRVAAFDIEMLGGTCRIINPFGQHPMKMVRAKGTQGYVSIHVEYCNWWIPDSNGKMFHSDGNVNWFFYKNDGQLHDSSHDAIILKIDNYFEGENRGYCPTYRLDNSQIIPNQCGRDVWSYTPLNR